MMMMMMHGLTNLKYQYQYQSNLDLFLVMLTERFRKFCKNKYSRFQVTMLFLP